jgi:hypothetical protein
MTWRPIESAPRDGTDVILGGKGWCEVGWWCHGWRNDGTRWGWYAANTSPSDCYDGSLNEATHWQPLPDPPVLENHVDDHG